MLIYQNKYSYQNSLLVFLATIIDRLGRFFIGGQSDNIDPGKINRILVIKLDNLGDCFLSLPLFDYLKRLNSAVVVDVLSLSASRVIFDHCPTIDNRYFVNRRFDILRPRMVKRIRGNRYDLIIDARGYWQAAFLGLLSGASERFGFAQEVGQFCYTHSFSAQANQPEIKRYATLLNKLGIIVNEWPPRLDLSRIDQDRFAQLINSGSGIIAIHPTASLPYKFWPIDYWRQLLVFLRQHYPNASIVILGSRSDCGFINDLFARVADNSGKIINYAGHIDIIEAYYLISQAILFVGNDSVLGHFAGALERPTITIMNRAIDSSRWSPLGQLTKVFMASDNGHQCRYDQCGYNCPNMMDIKPEVIIDYMRQLNI